MWPSPTATTSRMIVTLRMTINTAGRLIHAPVKTSPALVHPATAATTFACVHHWVGEPASWAGNERPKLLSSDTKWPDQPTPTVAAPAAYSSTRSHPMIQATISPMVAYEEVYALPATGTADAIS